MSPLVGRYVFQVMIAVVGALMLLILVHAVLGDPGAAIRTAAHNLFLFMDVGIGLWALLLLVDAAVRRLAASSAKFILFALIGAVVNFFTVMIVGFVQEGGLVTEFLGFALEAGIAVVLAAAAVAAGTRYATRRARHARVARWAK